MYEAKHLPANQFNRCTLLQYSLVCDAASVTLDRSSEAKRDFKGESAIIVHNPVLSDMFEGKDIELKFTSLESNLEENDVL